MDQNAAFAKARMRPACWSRERAGMAQPQARCSACGPGYRWNVVPRSQELFMLPRKRYRPATRRFKDHSSLQLEHLEERVILSASSLPHLPSVLPPTPGFAAPNFELSSDQEGLT